MLSLKLDFLPSILSRCFRENILLKMVPILTREALCQIHTKETNKEIESARCLDSKRGVEAQIVVDFVAFVLPSSGMSLLMYHTPFICIYQMSLLDGKTNSTNSH